MPSLADAAFDFNVSGSARVAGVHVRSTSQAHSASITVVTASTTSVQVLGANPNRVELILTNDSPSTCYVASGRAADSYNFTTFLPAIDRTLPHSRDYLRPPVYTGAIYAMWNSASGSLKITELTFG